MPKKMEGEPVRLEELLHCKSLDLGEVGKGGGVRICVVARGALLSTIGKEGGCVCPISFHPLADTVDHALRAYIERLKIQSIEIKRTCS